MALETGAGHTEGCFAVVAGAARLLLLLHGGHGDPTVPDARIEEPVMALVAAIEPDVHLVAEGCTGRLHLDLLHRVAAGTVLTDRKGCFCIVTGTARLARLHVGHAVPFDLRPGGKNLVVAIVALVHAGMERMAEGYLARILENKGNVPRLLVTLVTAAIDREGGDGIAEAPGVAGLLEAGVLDCTGRLLSPGEIPTNLGNRVRNFGGEPVFVLYQDAASLVYLSQNDIREMQLAKSAIRAGMEILFAHAGISEEGVERVVVTGSFGAELPAAALKSIGILTEKMVNISDFVREGVLAGVETALRCRDGFNDVERFAGLIRVIPLSGTPAFEKLFIEHMNFPERCK